MENHIFRVGLIGNRAHQTLLAGIIEKRADCRIVAAAEHHPAKALALGKRFGVPCAADYDAVLENPEVDFVSIATDFYLKHDLIKKAIACGKHVLVDKPIGRTVQEAKEICRAAASSGVKIMLTYPLRFDGAFARLSTAVRTHEVKELASYVHHWVRQYPDGDLMAYISYPTPALVNGGGELMNHGSHAVDYMYSVLGMPKRVYCRMENLYWDEYRAFGTEDFVDMTCEYDGFSAHVITGRNKVSGDIPNVNTVDLVARGQWIHVETARYAVNGEELAMPPSRQQPREECVQHFIDCILNDSAPVSGVATGLAVAEIVTAAYQSARSGQFVDLPLKDERHPLIRPEDHVVTRMLD